MRHTLSLFSPMSSFSLALCSKRSSLFLLFNKQEACCSVQRP